MLDVFPRTQLVRGADLSRVQRMRLVHLLGGLPTHGVRPGVMKPKYSPLSYPPLKKVRAGSSEGASQWDSRSYVTFLQLPFPRPQFPFPSTSPCTPRCHRKCPYPARGALTLLTIR